MNYVIWEYPDWTWIVTVIDNFDVAAKIRVINKKIDVLPEPSDDIFEFLRKDVSFLAWPKYVSIDFIDSAALNADLTPWSDGSSWIQDYSFHLKRIWVFPDEESVISPAVDICEETWHWVLNNDLTVALMKESISWLDCTDVSWDSSDRWIQKAWKYQYTITMLDHAWNTTIINGDFIVYPADVNSSTEVQLSWFLILIELLDKSVTRF